MRDDKMKAPQFFSTLGHIGKKRMYETTLLEKIISLAAIRIRHEELDTYRDLWLDDLVSGDHCSPHCPIRPIPIQSL